jgi:hypothetical protein
MDIRVQRHSPGNRPLVVSFIRLLLRDRFRSLAEDTSGNGCFEQAERSRLHVQLGLDAKRERRLVGDVSEAEAGEDRDPERPEPVGADLLPGPGPVEAGVEVFRAAVVELAEDDAGEAR